MIFTPTACGTRAIIDVERHGDERGFLARTFCESEFAEHGVAMPIVQSSTIYTPQRDTLRGLHFQEAPHREAKLVRCTRGSIFVVIVDLRPESPSWRGWLGVELTALNQRLVYVPRDSHRAIRRSRTRPRSCTTCRTTTCPRRRRGVRWDDPAFGIAWPPAEQRLISDRDRAWPDYSRVRYAVVSRPACSSRSAALRTTA